MKIFKIFKSKDSIIYIDNEELSLNDVLKIERGILRKIIFQIQDKDDQKQYLNFKKTQLIREDKNSEMI
jgi:hypothetical protein